MPSCENSHTDCSIFYLKVNYYDDAQIHLSGYGLVNKQRVADNDLFINIIHRSAIFKFE